MPETLGPNSIGTGQRPPSRAVVSNPFRSGQLLSDAITANNLNAGIVAARTLHEETVAGQPNDFDGRRVATAVGRITYTGPGGAVDLIGPAYWVEIMCYCWHAEPGLVPDAFEPEWLPDTRGIVAAYNMAECLPAIAKDGTVKQDADAVQRIHLNASLISDGNKPHFVEENTLVNLTYYFDSGAQEAGGERVVWVFDRTPGVLYGKVTDDPFIFGNTITLKRCDIYGNLIYTTTDPTAPNTDVNVYLLGTTGDLGVGPFPKDSVLAWRPFPRSESYNNESYRSAGTLTTDSTAHGYLVGAGATPLGTIFHCGVVQTGGSDGDAGSQASWTYDVSLGRLTDPVATGACAQNQRPSVGKVKKGTTGWGYFEANEAGDPVFTFWVNEVNEQEACPS